MLTKFIILATVLFTGNALAQPGALDPTFNGTGYALQTFETSLSNAMSTCVDPGGKIITAGYKTDTTVNPAVSSLMLIRYLSGGSLDPDFGSGGVVTTDYYGQAYFATLQPDGKILVAATLSKTGSETNRKFTILRFNNDGTFDEDFGEGGLVQDTLGVFSSSIAILPDGRILAAGAGYTSGSPSWAFYLLAMHHADGSVDTTFGNSGFVTTMIPNATAIYVMGMVIQADGKILLGDAIKIGTLGTRRLAMVRYKLDGSLDPGFGSNGVVIDSAGVRNGCEKLALQSDGKIMVPSYVYLNDLTHPFYSLIRYNPDGTRDSTFGNNGIIIGEGGVAYNIVIQPDGKIISCGYLKSDSTVKHAVVMRYLPTGEPDAGFGVGGCASPGMEPPGALRGLGLSPDGKIVVAGYCNESTTWSNTMTARLNSFGVGMPETEPGQTIRISPNPFKDFITIETPGISGSLIDIYSMQGQKVETLRMEGEKGCFSLGHLPAGSYFLKSLNIIPVSTRLLIKVK